MYADGENIDTITVYAKLKKSDDLRKAGGAPYLATLIQAYKSADNVAAYAEIVLDQWKIRKANELGQRVLTITDNADEVAPALEAIRSFLDEVDEDNDAESLNFRDLYDAWTTDQADDRPVIETPFLSLNDRLSGGFQRQRLYVIGARPGCGKTILGTQCAEYAAKMYNKSLIFSLELTKEDLMGRILAMGAHVPYNEITSRRISTESRAAISRWVAASAEKTLEVDDTPDLTIEEIAHRCRIHKQRKGLDFVFIDYLQLMGASGHPENRVQQVDHMALKARSIARRLDVVVVVAAQLNRKIEDHGGKPRLPSKSDFRESGGIEQTADVALVLSRPPDENGEETKMPMMNLSLVKNRTGTEGTFKLVERFDQARFEQAMM